MADKFQQLVDEEPIDFDEQVNKARDQNSRRNTPQYDVRRSIK